MIDITELIKSIGTYSEDTIVIVSEIVASKLVSENEEWLNYEILMIDYHMPDTHCLIGSREKLFESGWPIHW